ncbi:MAG: hypothetical protein IKF36_04750 [Bacilli bacterium]|nr:hypothetical protein [Bacilli bacterium]
MYGAMNLTDMEKIIIRQKSLQNTIEMLQNPETNVYLSQEQITSALYYIKSTIMYDIKHSNVELIGQHAVGNAIKIQQTPIVYSTFSSEEKEVLTKFIISHTMRMVNRSVKEVPESFKANVESYISGEHKEGPSL